MVACRSTVHNGFTAMLQAVMLAPDPVAEAKTLQEATEHLLAKPLLLSAAEKSEACRSLAIQLLLSLLQVWSCAHRHLHRCTNSVLCSVRLYSLNLSTCQSLLSAWSSCNTCHAGLPRCCDISVALRSPSTGREAATGRGELLPAACWHNASHSCTLPLLYIVITS